MLKYLIILTLCIASNIFALTQEQIHQEEQNVRKYLKLADERIFGAFKRFQDIQFQSNIEDPALIFNEYLNAMKVVNQTAQELKHYHYHEFHVDLKREVEAMINSVGLFILTDNEIKQLSYSLQRLHLLPTMKNICPYNRNQYQKCDFNYIQDVTNIIKNSRNPDELKHYWMEWRKIVSRDGIQDLDQVIYMYKRAARNNNQEPIELWFKDYEDKHFLSTLIDVMKQLDLFYQDIHAYIRYVLRQKYGEAVVSIDGPIPHHLYEQVLIQAWDPNSVVEHPYPNVKLPDFQYKIEPTRYGGEKLVREAEKFFEPLHIDTLPPTFWAYNLKQKPEEGFGDECKAVVYDFIPDGALKYCPQTNFKKFLQMHGYLARLHYINNERNQSYAFYDSYNFEHGVAEAVILSASSPKHIKKIGLLPDYEYTYESKLNRLFRLAVHTMLNLPIYFVQSKLLSDILMGHVQLRHVNLYYWQMMEKYVGVEPAYNRLDSDLDFGFKFFEDLTENHQTRKFVGEILGYQFYRALCELSGEYVKNSTNMKLQECDFHSGVLAHKAGEKLKSMMESGSSLPYRAVLNKLLRNDADLNAAALLEFFEPVREFLTQEIQRKNIYVGWKSSNKQIRLTTPPDIPIL